MRWNTTRDVREWLAGSQADDLPELKSLALALGATAARPFPLRQNRGDLSDGGARTRVRSILPAQRGVYALGLGKDERHRVIYIGRSGYDDGRTRKGGVGGRLWDGRQRPPDWLRNEILGPLREGVPARVLEKLESADEAEHRLPRRQLYPLILAVFGGHALTFHVWQTDSPQTVERRMLALCHSNHGSDLPMHGRG